MTTVDLKDFGLSVAAASVERTAELIDQLADELISLRAAGPLAVTEKQPGTLRSYVQLGGAAEQLQGAINRFLHVVQSHRADRAGDL